MSDTDPILSEALRLVEQGEWEGAAVLLREALEENQEDPAVLCWLGVAEREMGLDGAAYDLFKRCLAVGTKDPHLLAMAGAGVAAFDDPDAEAALRTAAVLGPHVPLARLMYGSYLAREGMLEEGVGELTVARELDPDDPAIALELGVALALQGDPASTLELERASVLEPEDGWIRILLGLATLEFEDDAGESAGLVAEQLEAGARLRPEDVEAQLLASLALFAAGYEDRAWEMLERARPLAAGADLHTLLVVEERLEEGGDGPGEFLRNTLLPSALRDRLMERP